MKWFLVLLLSILALVMACESGDGGPESNYTFTACTDTVTAISSDSSSTLSLTGTSWLYMLQDLVPATVASTSFDIVVMDYSSDGCESGEYSSANITTIKNSSKTVLAYLSIGEAEDYRYYFDSSWLDGLQPGSNAPCWLNRTNSDWAGNYKVQYWSEAWQQVILGYLDKIIAQGFDGVYLDIIDAYEYWSDSSNGEGYSITEEEAALHMINFVKRLSYHARVTRNKPGFLVVPQNGEAIIDYDDGRSGHGANDYLKTIDGAGIEDLYYDERSPIDTSETNYRKVYIDTIKNYPSDDSKKILVVDYVDNGSHDAVVADFRNKTTTDGYVPYAGMQDRELNTINTFTGQP